MSPPWLQTLQGQFQGLCCHEDHCGIHFVTCPSPQGSAIGPPMQTSAHWKLTEHLFCALYVYNPHTPFLFWTFHVAQHMCGTFLRMKTYNCSMYSRIRVCTALCICMTNACMICQKLNQSVKSQTVCDQLSNQLQMLLVPGTGYDGHNIQPCLWK